MADAEEQAARSLEWRRPIVVNGIRRLTAAGGQSPNFEALRGMLGLGHDDLRNELKALKAEGAVTEEQGRFTVSGDEPVHAPPPPVPEALLPEEEQLRADPDPEPEAPAVAGNGTGELADEDHDRTASTGAATHVGAATPADLGDSMQVVQLTAGMVESLNEESLGALVKAGIAEAKQRRRPFLLRVE